MDRHTAWKFNQEPQDGQDKNNKINKPNKKKPVAAIAAGVMALCAVAVGISISIIYFNNDDGSFFPSREEPIKEDQVREDPIKKDQIGEAQEEIGSAGEAAQEAASPIWEMFRMGMVLTYEEASYENKAYQEAAYEEATHGEATSEKTIAEEATYEEAPYEKETETAKSISTQGQGVTVLAVIQGSKAYKQGVQPGDKIIKINDNKIDCVDDMTGAFAKGEKHSDQIVFLRGEDEIISEFVIGEGENI